MQMELKIKEINKILVKYSQIQGEHHKNWCFDQIARILFQENYGKFIEKYENDGEYKWDKGIAP